MQNEGESPLFFCRLRVKLYDAWKEIDNFGRRFYGRPSFKKVMENWMNLPCFVTVSLKLG